MTIELHGKNALVTGASRGIGRAIALELAALGARTALVARSSSLLESLAKEINDKNSGDAIYKSLDIEKESFALELAKWLKAEGFHVDVLVNNAGIYSTDYISLEHADGWEVSDPGNDDLWKRTMAVNLNAPYILAKVFAPAMIERKWGRIINISSISGQKAEAYGTAYSASKFGLIGVTQSLALELARHGITVNSVCPGWVETDMAQEQINDPEWCRLNDINPEESLDIARLSVPQMRLIQPDEVAGLVGYLCSDRAKGITGQAINICGGLSIS
ncbi:SDR family oxidoreductase [Candidatus Obscuribacterales bacterium]|nr:SDR family oxidoreductase [Candidatus Obscuribacterales bacterium]MBX3151553.1 SDR family oxidoreductase [Candidatus Obscuribacterales bacterium]